MTSQEKKIIFSIILVLVIILLGTMLFSKGKKNNEETEIANKQGNNEIARNEENSGKFETKLDDGTKLNTSADLKNAKRYKTLEIGNIQVSSKEGNSTILANVKNTENSVFTRERVKLILIGENGEEIATMQAVIPELQPGKTSKINAMVTDDIANIKDFRIEEK